MNGCSFVKYSADIKGLKDVHAVNVLINAGSFHLNNRITLPAEVLIINPLNLSAWLSLQVSQKGNVAAGTFRIGSFNMHTRCSC